MAAQNSAIQVSQAPTTTRKINSFVLWMEAWNVYTSILMSAYPACAQELLGYQRLITSANLQLPFSSWLSYDVKFCTLAATCPSLRWDTRHPDLWLERLTTSKSPMSECWLCPHCNSIYHFPDRCPFHDDRSSNFTSTNRLPADLRTSGPRNSQSPQSYHSSSGQLPMFVETSTIKEGVHDHTAAAVSKIILILTYTHCPTVPLMTPFSWLINLVLAPN